MTLVKFGILRLAILYFLLLIVFTLSIIAVNYIPKAAIKNNVAFSAEQIDKEGLYKKIANFKLFQLDNYTDVLMLNIALSGDPKMAIESSMMAYWYKSTNYLALAKDTKKNALGDFSDLNKESYGRYWHGYLIVLKPLLCFFDYGQIRIINYFIFLLLFIVSSYLIYKRLGGKIMSYFIASFCLINVFIIPLSMQFSNMFYLAFISIIYLLKCEQKFTNNTNAILFFFALGGLTSYFDFLTTPLVTLGLPLTIYFLIDKSNKSVQNFFILSLFWFFGYSSIWASKWLMGVFLTNKDFLTSVFQQVKLRTSSSYKGMDMTLFNIVVFCYTILIKKKIFFTIVVIFFILCFSSIAFLIKRNVKLFRENLPYIAIFLLFPVWFLFLRNHTIQHGWFTWRTIVIMIFSIQIFLSNMIEYTKANKI